MHAIASIGALQEEQALSHGLQWPVALAAKPAGHAARHWPRCMSGVLLLEAHVRQLASSGPSHVAQVAWQLPHVPLVVTYMRLPQPERS